MRLVKWTPQLTDEEEAQLLAYIANGLDAQQADNRLIAGYQPPSHRPSKQFVQHWQQMEQLDLVQESNLELLQALKGYNGGEGLRPLCHI